MPLTHELLSPPEHAALVHTVLDKLLPQELMAASGALSNIWVAPGIEPKVEAASPPGAHRKRLHQPQPGLVGYIGVAAQVAGRSTRGLRLKLPER